MSTYAQLVSDVAAWSARTDLADVIPAMVGIVEARANRELRVSQMEASFTGTIGVDNTIPLPADYLQFKTLWDVSTPKWPIIPQTLEQVRSRTAGTPTYYAKDGATVRFNGAGDVAGIYYQAIPGLQANDTNWLSLAHYDAYLFSVLAEVADYMKDEAALAKYYARAKAIWDNIEGADMRLSGPLAAVKR